MSSYEDLMKMVHEKASEFDCHLTKVKVANDALVRRSAEVLKGLTELFGTVREAQKCPVCYTREQKIALMPCGHVFCTSCSDRARRSRCHICRLPVENQMRVFL